METTVKKKTTAKATAKKPAVKKTEVKKEVKKESLKLEEVESKTIEKVSEKNTENGFQKAEEKILKANSEKSQKADSQSSKVLEDFFNTPTENATETKQSNEWSNPPLEGENNTTGPETVTTGDGREIPSPESGHADFNEFGFRSVENEEMEASTDFNANEFFEDEDLMAETILEILDMGAVMGISALAKDFNNPSADIKWGLTDSKKRKILKPLKMVLAKREVRTSPEMMLIGVLLASYLPLILTAFAERSTKKKLEQKRKNPSVADKKKEAIVSQTKKDGRPLKCTTCKNEVEKCNCPEGPSLSKYAQKKLGVKNEVKQED